MTPLTRCMLTGQDPCQGVISQLVGPVVPVTVRGQGLLPGVLVPTSDYFRYLTLGSEVFVVGQGLLQG